MLAITNATIEPVIGDIIDNGTILIDDQGKIEALGAQVTPPADCRIIDGRGKVVTPGLIDAHCHVGMLEDSLGLDFDVNESSDPLTPQMRAIDGIYSFCSTFKDALKGGVTTIANGPGSGNIIGGSFVAMKTAGSDIDQMVIKNPLAMKCAFGENPKRLYGDKKKSPATRMAIAAMLRQHLQQALAYRDKPANSDPEKKPPFEMKMEAMQPVINREIPLKAHCHRADDILTALRIAREFDLKITLDHCTEGHLIADEIAASGAPAIVGPTLSSKVKFELYNISWDTPKILQKAGVLVALNTDHPIIPIQYLSLCAIYVAKSGLCEREALKMITINPAKILQLDDQVGSLEIGKNGDLVIWDGPPLRQMSKIETTLIDGRVVYDKNEEGK